MAHTSSRKLVRSVALVVALLGCAPFASAQLKLPRRPAEKPEAKPKGDIAPYMVCLVCGNRTYTAHVDGRKDEAGNDYVWCTVCKHDTGHRSSVNSDPGIATGSPGAGGDLALPRRTNPASEPAAAPANPAPAQPPVSPDAPPATSTAPAGPPVTPNAPRSANAFVFDDLRRAKGADDPLLERAVESLLAAGDVGLDAARAEVASMDANRLLVAARTLLRAGNAADVELLITRIHGKVPASTGAILVDEIAARDPVRAGPDWLASLLEHPQALVRQAAQRALAKTSSSELLMRIEKIANDKRSETRLAAIELAATSTDSRATDILLAHMDDASSRIASSATSALALREDAGLDARLLSIAFRDRWVLRRGAYALVAIVEREDLRLQPILDASHVEPLLAALESSDAFIAGTAATALAGIGFRARDTRASEWLDHGVVDRLVMTVSGQQFHDDLSSITPAALRRLRLVTGQSFVADGPRWVDWWISARKDFSARRATLTIDPKEVASVLVRFESSDKVPEAFALVGPDGAPAAQVRITSGEILYLNHKEIADLVATLTREGLLSAEKLPGWRGTHGRGERTLEIQVGSRAKSFSFGPGTKEAWFERAQDACRALREQNRWQRFPVASRGQDALDLWRQQSDWWSGDRTREQRDERLKSLVLASMHAASPAQRELGLLELERLYAEPTGPNGADFEPILAQVKEEKTPGDRALRLSRLALAAGRKLGSDGFVPDAQALSLAMACTSLFGTNAVDALLEQFKSARPEFVRARARDDSPVLRAVAARTLAKDPSPEDFAVLIQLLDDKDQSVETAAALALGEHKVEAARTELLVRARVGLTPVRTASLEAIGKLGGEFVLEALIQGIHDNDRAVRIAAAKGLSVLADPAAAQVLIAELGEVGDTDLFDAARAGLLSMGKAAWPDLVRAVNQPAGRIRREAALILSEQSSPDAASPLLAILTSNPKDARVANELSILTCIDMRGQSDPAQSWWGWWDGVRHDDAIAWFRAALERLGVAPPAPGVLEGAANQQGLAFLVVVMGRPEPWLVERARRAYRDLSGRDPGDMPPVGLDRDAWLRALRESAAKETSRG